MYAQWIEQRFGFEQVKKVKHTSFSEEGKRKVKRIHAKKVENGKEMCNGQTQRLSFCADVKGKNINKPIVNKSGKILIHVCACLSVVK